MAERFKALEGHLAGIRGVVRSGMLSSITVGGLVEAMRTLAVGDVEPSNIFKILAENLSTKPAMITDDERLTYRELNERIQGIAGGLQANGLRRGDKVVLMMHNSPRFVEAYNAAIRAGAAAVTASYHLRGEELAYIINNSEARAIVFDDSCSEAVDAAVPHVLGAGEGLLRVPIGRRPRAGEVAYEALNQPQAFKRVPKQERQGTTIVYTSGTTGNPKGAVRNMSSLGVGLLGKLLSSIPIRQDDVHLVSCPLYHSLGSAFAMIHFAVGATLVMLPEFEAEAALQAVERHRVSSLVMVPTMLRRLVDVPLAVARRYDTSSLRLIVSGASHLPQELRERIIGRFGPVLYDMYGATETGIVSVANSSDMLLKPGTIGKPFWGNSVRILDDHGREVPPNSPGELYVKNDQTIEGYYRNADATNKSQRDGFFSVGDVARQDEDGYLFLEDRKIDMVITGGVNVYPKEIEDVLLRHGEVKDVAVLGVPDEQWGERLIAVIVTPDGAPRDPGELIGYCREKLARFKVPKAFYFVEELPKGNTGKVLKRRLRERFGELEPPSS